MIRLTPKYAEKPLSEISARLNILRGDVALPPNVTVVIPVNAQEDLKTVFQVVTDLVAYSGAFRVAVLLVINNYSPAAPPSEIESYEKMGFQIAAISDARKPDEGVILSARMYGLEFAQSEHIIFFDADCYIPNPTALVDWYIAQLDAGIQLAHTRVDYYDLSKSFSVWLRMVIHDVTRFLKRMISIPPNQGCNYAVNRTLTLDLYRQGKFVRDMFVGPAVKSVGGQIAYSGSKRLRVVTSGRKINPGWRRFFRYLAYRIQYNARLFPIRFGKQ